MAMNKELSEQFGSAPIESGESEEGVIPMGEVIDSEAVELPEGMKQAITNRGIEAFRTIFDGLKNYVVFASTAAYLQGRKREIPELQRAPGDFDVAVFDERTFNEIRERLVRFAGVEFANNEPTEKEQKEAKRFLTQDDLAKGRAMVVKHFPGESTSVLQGRLIVEVTTEIGQQKFSIPFEIFLHSRMVDKRLHRYQDTAEGLNTLSLEGLQKQYLNNLEMESRLSKAVEKVQTYLDSEPIRTILWREIERKDALKVAGGYQPDSGVANLLLPMDLSLDDVERYFTLCPDPADRASLNPAERQLHEEAVAKIFSGGLKTKLEKRQANATLLRDLQKLQVGQSEQDEPVEELLAAK